jgi:hypothetical protein
MGDVSPVLAQGGPWMKNKKGLNALDPLFTWLPDLDSNQGPAD